MTIKHNHLLFLFGGMFTLGLVPLGLLYTSGGLDGVSFSAGFMQIFQHPLHLASLLFIGVFSVFWSGSTRCCVFPVSLMLGIALGSGMMLMSQGYPAAMLPIVVVLLVYGVLLNRLRSGAALGSALALSAAGFFMGRAYISQMLEITSAGYYIAGVLLAALLLLGSGVSLGFLVIDLLEHGYRKVRENPGVTSILSMFGIG